MEQMESRSTVDPPTRETTIHDLPDEILLHIFELGCDEEPIVPKDVRCLHPFIVPVFSVCSHWRAICSPTKQNPLFYYICIKLVSDDALPSDVLAERFTAFERALFGLSNCQLYVKLYFYDMEEQLFLSDLQMGAVRLVFEHARWLQGINVYISQQDVAKCFATCLLGSNCQHLKWTAQFPARLCTQITSFQGFNTLGSSLTPLQLSLLEPQEARVRVEGNFNSSDSELGTHIHHAILQKIVYFRIILPQLPNLTYLHIYFPKSYDEAIQETLTVPVLRCLILEDMTLRQARVLFSLLNMPRLRKLIVWNAEEIYPLYGVTLSSSIDDLSCGTSTGLDWSRQLRCLKDTASFQPAGELFRGVFQDRFIYTCRMESTFVNVHRKTWDFMMFPKLIKASVLLKGFRDIFEDRLRGSPGGRWLIALESLIHDALELEEKDGEMS